MYIQPMEFEEKWAKLLDDFNLKENKWLKYMYAIRNRWIPAYFRDMHLCGLMRTTSRSESENSFFSNFTNRGSTLVNFMICFESAMEKQRYRQEILDHKTIETVPTFKTPLQIERQASKVYTRSLFLLVQKEIYESVWSCSFKAVSSEEGSECYIVNAKTVSKRKQTNTDEVGDKETEVIEIIENRQRDHKVIRNTVDGSIVCTCNHFVRHGILCRHVFYVLKNCDIEEVPKRYLLRRWKRDIIPADLRNKRKRYDESNEEIEKLANDATSTVDECINMLSKHEEKFKEFVQKLKKLKTETEVDLPKGALLKKADVIKDLTGITKPDTIEVQNPEVSRNKGCGTKDRWKSTKEKVKEGMKKPKRKCGRCGKLTRKHDKRNCERVTRERAEMKAKRKAEEEARAKENPTLETI